MSDVETCSFRARSKRTATLTADEAKKRRSAFDRMKIRKREMMSLIDVEGDRTVVEAVACVVNAEVDGTVAVVDEGAVDVTPVVDADEL